MDDIIIPKGTIVKANDPNIIDRREIFEFVIDKGFELELEKDLHSKDRNAFCTIPSKTKRNLKIKSFRLMIPARKVDSKKTDVIISKGEMVEIVKPKVIRVIPDIKPYYSVVKRGAILEVAEDVKIGDKYITCIIWKGKTKGQNKDVMITMQFLARNTRRVEDGNA